MVYEAFLSAVRDSLQQQLGNDYELSVRRVMKNNGILLDGLCINRKGESIAPTIYLNSYYDELDNDMNLDDIVRDIRHLYTLNQSLPGISFDNFNNWEQVKNIVAYKIIHADSNLDLLMDIPHIPYLDLAIVFYLYLSDEEHGSMTALIHNSHLKTWNISMDTLYETAKINTKRLLPAKIKSMHDVVFSIINEECDKDSSRELSDAILSEENYHPKMYLLSNNTGMNGACCILYENVLKDFSDSLNMDLYILPSSIHDVILIPFGESSDISEQELMELVKNVNEEAVPVEERLSNMVYRYSHTDNTLAVISDLDIPIYN